MATRPQIESLLQAYLDEELSPAEKVLFERERAASPELAQAVDAARDVSAQLFEALGAQRLDYDLADAVMAHLPEMEGGSEYKRQEFAREATWRAKHPRSRARWFLTAVSAMAPVVLAVLAAAIIQAWPAPEMQPRMVGMLTSVMGTARLHDAGGVMSRDASLLSVVHPGDAVETQSESGLVLALSGPTQLKASSGSRFKVIGARAIQLEKGRIWLSVSKHSERFRVRTAMGDITVFGTVFSVDVAPQQVTVTLQEGEVTVENGQDFTVLAPGEQAVLRQGELTIPKQAVDARALHAWADAMQPDPAAHAEFLASMGPLEESVLRAEQVWWVDTHNRGGLSAMSFRWEVPQTTALPMSYDVLVYNDNMQPLFSRRLDGALLANATARQLELQIPSGESFGGTTFVRLVPDESTGQTEVAFKEVSLIGVPSPAAQ